MIVHVPNKTLPNFGLVLAVSHLQPASADGQYSCDVEVTLLPAEEFDKCNATDFPDSRSFESDLRLINGWIGDCALNHKKCRGGSRNWYPTRLLHFGSQGQNVRLIISEEEPPNGPYATLSHRWGEHKYETLNPSSMERLKRGVVESTLPQIFRDAIRIAHCLHVNYLWIDGLCIQQGEDYRSDWTRESQQMGQIYSNAFLNISATLSENGTESLFQRRPWTAAVPALVEIDLDGQPERYYILDGDLWKNEVDEAPLSHRGWVFQERILSQRVIHFGPSQIGWECKELDALEMFPHGLPGMAALSTMRKCDILRDGPATTQGHGSGLDTFVYEWHQIVAAYSRCALSKESDKLVAFLGIAERLMQSRPDTYVAGMWGKSLIYDLAWVRLGMDIQVFPLSKTSYRAPSWSWASVDGEIIFPNMIGGVQGCFVSQMQLLPAGDDNTHPICNAKVQARGLCLPLKLKHANGNLSGVEVVGLHFMADKGGPDQKMALEDSAQGLAASGAAGRLLLLPLFTTPYVLTGIMLAKTRGVGAHIRVGSVHLQIMGEVPDGVAEPEGFTRDRDGKYCWSVQVLKLLRHIAEHLCQSRTIDIF